MLLILLVRLTLCQQTRRACHALRALRFQPWTLEATMQEEPLLEEQQEAQQRLAVPKALAPLREVRLLVHLAVLLQELAERQGVRLLIHRVAQGLMEHQGVGHQLVAPPGALILLLEVALQEQQAVRQEVMVMVQATRDQKIMTQGMEMRPPIQKAMEAMQATLLMGGRTMKLRLLPIQMMTLMMTTT